MADIDNACGHAIRILRNERGLSQEALGMQANLHRTYISQLERGLKSPSLKTLQKIAAILNISLSKMMQLIEAEHNEIKQN